MIGMADVAEDFSAGKISFRFIPRSVLFLLGWKEATGSLSRNVRCNRIIIIFNKFHSN